MLTLSDRLRLLAFDLLLWGWPSREVAPLYEAAERLEREIGKVNPFGLYLGRYRAVIPLG